MLGGLSMQSVWSSCCLAIWSVTVISSLTSDKEDCQEEWRTAVLHDGKYVNLLVGQKTDKDIRVERDEENHYGSGPWDEVTKNYFLAYHQVKAHQRWLALRPNEAEHYHRFQVRTCV
jgi:hypothetical protein